MRYLMSILVGVLIGAYVAANVSTTSVPVGKVQLTHHDAAGHTRTAQATATRVEYIAGGSLMYIDYTSDQMFCSAFGP